MLKNLVFLSTLLIFLVSTPVGAEEKIGECLACHQKETQGIFQAWVNSQHAKKGVDCITCHKNHEEAKAKKSAVDPETCGKCHQDRLRQFKKEDTPSPGTG